MVRKWHWKKETKDGFKKLKRKGIIISYYEIEENDCFYVLIMKNGCCVVLDKSCNLIEV